MGSRKLDPGYFTEKDLYDLDFKKIGSNVSISKNSTFIGTENISIGNNVRIDGNVTFAAKSGLISIGDYIHIGSCSHINGIGEVHIHDYCTISQGVRIYSAIDDFSGETHTGPMVSSNLRKIVSGKVILNKYVVIGSGSVILPSTEIGVGTAVGALSLVKKNLKDWSIYAGIPVRKVGSRSKNLLSLQ
jgi:galactoside O-acetyltransferase